MSNDRVRAGVDADRRLVILRLLVEYRGALNSAVLEEGVRAWDHRYIDRSLINDDARWLAARSLVEVETLRPDVLEVVITARGERAASGDEWVDGVARPSRA